MRCPFSQKLYLYMHAMRVYIKRTRVDNIRRDALRWRRRRSVAAALSLCGAAKDKVFVECGGWVWVDAYTTRI